MGLYKPIRSTFDYLTDPVRRRRVREIGADLEATRRETAAWAGDGLDRVDCDRRWGLMAFTNLPLYAKWTSLIAKALQLEGLNPVIFSFSGCRSADEYYRLFGISEVVYWDRFEADLASTAPDLEPILDELLPERITVPRLVAVDFHGVEVGKHALSMTCRKLVQGSLNLDEPGTLSLLRKEMAAALRGVLAAEQFLDQTALEGLLVRDAGYTPNGAIYEVALSRGVDCVLYEQGHRAGAWVLKRYSAANKGEHYFSLADSTWDRVRKQPWGVVQERRVESEFAGRYKPDSTDDTRRLMAGKRLKSPDEVRAQLGLDPSKKTAVIFSHIAWDAAFFFGSCLFNDFEDWLFQTVKFVAAECPEINWVVKLHPFNALKLQREEKSEESEMVLLRTLMPLPDHICIVRADTDISTQSLFPLVDYVLTVNGTVGMEFPCFGIPAILGGSGRYSGRGFTVDPGSRDEYFEVLRELHRMPRLPEEQRLLARRYFYAVSLGRQTDFRDVAPMELKKAHEGQSDVHNNIRFTARSLQEFGSAPSVAALRHWLVSSREPDLYQDPAPTGPES